MELGALRQLGLGRRLGERAAQLAQLQRLADDLVVALRGVDGALVAVVELRVEEGRRLALRLAGRPRRRWRRSPGSSRAGSRSRGRRARRWLSGCRGGRRSPRCTCPPGPARCAQSIRKRLVRVKRCWPRAAGIVTAWPEWPTASPAAAEAHSLMAEQLAVRASRRRRRRRCRPRGAH